MAVPLYRSTSLPPNNSVPEIRKGLLDLLIKINEVSAYYGTPSNLLALLEETGDPVPINVDKVDGFDFDQGVKTTDSPTFARVITPQVDNAGGDLKIIPAGRTALVKADDSAIYDSNSGSNVNQFTPFMASGGGGFQTAGISVANGNTDASYSVWKKNSGGKRIRRAAWGSTPTIDTAGNENGTFDILTMNAGVLASRVAVTPGGYTYLGADAGAPPIKLKKLTGTTGATEGSTVTVAHGLTLSKIIGISVLVQADDGNWLPNSFPIGIGAEGEFSFYLTPTNLAVVLHPTNSANLTGNAFKALITYEE